MVVMSRAAFVRRVWAALTAFRDRGGTPLPPSSKLILLAQAAYETGWGRTAAASGRNWFNLTAGSSWRGPIVPGPDTEPDGRGGWRNITQAWRAYAEDTGAVADLYDNWLTWPAYQAAKRPLLMGDLAGYLAALRAGGYFTQDLTTYTTNVAAVRATAEKLIPTEATS